MKGEEGWWEQAVEKQLTSNKLHGEIQTISKVKQKSKRIRNSFKWEVGGNRKTEKPTNKQTNNHTQKTPNQTKKDKVNPTH